MAEQTLTRMDAALKDDYLDRRRKKNKRKKNKYLAKMRKKGYGHSSVAPQTIK